MNILHAFWFFLKFSLYRPNSVLLYFKLKWNKNFITTVNGKRVWQFFKRTRRESSYYSGLLNSIKFERGQAPEALKQVSSLSRSTLRLNLPKILVTLYKYRSGSTGGSTGEPLKYYQNHNYPVEAFRWHYHDIMGLAPWSNSIHIWRIPKTKQSILRQFEHILQWPTRRIKIDSAVLTSETKEYAVKELLHRRVPLVQGYVGAISELADYILDHGVKIDFVKAVWVTSAPLSNGILRKLEIAFNCDVWDEYGSSEVPYIGLRNASKEENLTVNSGYRLLEIVNPNYHGVGDIVITDLLNKSMPLVRYELGDRGILVSEQNGYATKIKPVKGRQSDHVFVTNKVLLEGSFLTTIFDDFAEEIKQFKIVQHSIGELQIQVIWECAPHIRLKIKRHVEKQLITAAKTKFTITFEDVNVISHDRGKLKFIECHV